MDNIKIIKLEKEDLKDVSVVIREGFTTVIKEYNLTEKCAKGNSGFIKYEELVSNWHKGKDIFGLYHNAKLLGTIQMEEKNKGYYYIKHFTILPEYRGRGLGSKLLNFIRKIALEEGGKSISLGAMALDENLINYYEKHGYILKKIRKFRTHTYRVAFMELDLQKNKV